MSEGKKPKSKRPVGRPPLQFPDLIDADPADVAKAAFKLNPNKPGFEWQYLKDADKPQKRR
ncbi:MAG: hypothetical protein OXI34_03110 [Chloroflexota bacterium]|nr:hypothetical protein [Chloroflexota bacterium]MDE2947810.1 hypothetical protein [Chloroflexota bacterium]